MRKPTPAHHASSRRCPTTWPRASRSLRDVRSFSSRRRITSGASPYPRSGRRPRRAASPTFARDPTAPGTDGDVHNTTSVAFAEGTRLRLGRLVMQRDDGQRNESVRRSRSDARRDLRHGTLDGSGFRQRAKRIRNAIALAVNPQSASCGSAAPDKTICRSAIRTSFSTISRRTPAMPTTVGRNARRTITRIGPAPTVRTRSSRSSSFPHTRRSSARRSIRLRPAGPYAFPARYRGGLFAAAHGSWHHRPNRLLRRTAARRFHPDARRRAGKAGRLDESGDRNGRTSLRVSKAGVSPHPDARRESPSVAKGASSSPTTRPAPSIAFALRAAGERSWLKR